MGLKLRQAMADKGVSQAEVAREFGVAASTVSVDWRMHGRIHKKHYPRLVGYFGKPYEWWFGDPVGGDTRDIYAIRRDNLWLALRDTWGGSPTLAAKALGLGVEELHNLLNPATRRHPIVPTLARKIERVGKLGAGWMDLPHTQPDATAKRKRA